MRVAIELLIDTGRRPDEACELDYDCPAGAASMTGKTTAAARISC